MIIWRMIAFMAVASLAVGCAVGNQYDYRAGSASVPDTGASRIAIAVTDLRSYVVTGEKPVDFVGLQRGGFGNPFDVTTSSGAPLASDFADLLRNSFATKGAEADVIPLTADTEAEAAVAAFMDSDADRLLIVEVHEWKTDVYAQVTVHWNLTAKVFDRSGRRLAEESLRGVQGTGTSGLFEAEKNRIATAEASKRFSELLARPAIAAALR